MRTSGEHLLRLSSFSVLEASGGRRWLSVSEVRALRKHLARSNEKLHVRCAPDHQPEIKGNIVKIPLGELTVHSNANVLDADGRVCV
jgi:hypothetical protein